MMKDAPSNRLAFVDLFRGLLMSHMALDHASLFFNPGKFGNEFAAQQLVDLDRYEVVVKLLEDGTNKQPFRARTLAPLENRVGRRKKLIARSRERFAASRAAVETKLNRWLDSPNKKSA